MGVVDREAGIIRIFTDEGQALPVTVIEVEPNRITQLKTLESDGYRAVQVTEGLGGPPVETRRLLVTSRKRGARVGGAGGKSGWLTAKGEGWVGVAESLVPDS